MTAANIAKMLPGPLCPEAREWLETQPDARTAWESCRRGDWLLYQLGHARGVDRRQLVLAACECARMALRYVPAGDDSPRIAIETAEAWCRGEATMEQVLRARYDTYDLGAGTRARAIAGAVAAAAGAIAYASATSAYDVATYAAYAAYAAANLDEAEDARRSVLAQCADIVRAHFAFEDLVSEAPRKETK